MHTTAQTNPDSDATSNDSPGHWLTSARVRFWSSVVAGVLLLTSVVLGKGFDVEPALWLAWVSLAMGMVYGLRAGWMALRDLSIDIDVLMVVGAAMAASVGHAEEGALLLFLFVLSGALEDLALARTRREIEALHNLMPTEAIRWNGVDWSVCSPDDLVPGDRIKIRPGDVLPVDATIDQGHSSVDQSTLTGESMPRRVVEGDEVYAGTINLARPIEAQVTRTASESSLQKILNLVTEAREQREPIQRLIDRVSEPYAIGVLFTSTLVILIWWFVLGFTFNDAAYVAITFLIVLSPCAVIIATPTVTLTTIARGARAGVLFKGGQSIDRLARTTAVCFDKTGTLTEGKPSLSRINAIGWSDPARLLAVAAGLETDSTHPIARAVHEAARAQGVDPLPVHDTIHEPGQGIIGSIDGARVAIGLFDYVEEIIPHCLRALTRQKIQEVHHAGMISAVIAAGGEQGASAVCMIEDPVRVGARDLVEQLDALGLAPVRMLTGDSEPAAAYIANSLGLDDWRAHLLPEDKVRLVREMSATGEVKVAFIGDGVNDAPALAAADVSIGIGSIGSDAALESSDIVLLSDNLANVPWAIKLARRARSILRFNMIFALTIIVGMGLATLVGSLRGWQVEMWVGVLAHEGGTLFVVLNALRLLWAKSAVALDILDEQSSVKMGSSVSIESPLSLETAI